MKGDIEKRIIDFIKRSPIGVTSSEIARFLNVNRITITKYLAIIKERTLIDFKQFGMAKIWYIPVDINKDYLLTSMVIEIAKNPNPDSIRKAGLKIGKEISEIYQKFHGDKIQASQLPDVIVDAMNKIGCDAWLESSNEKRIVIKNRKCPFGKSVKECPSLCSVTSNIVGTLVAKNIGYGKVHLQKTIAKGSNEDLITVHLEKT